MRLQEEKAKGWPYFIINGQYYAISSWGERVRVFRCWSCNKLYTSKSFWKIENYIGFCNKKCKIQYLTTKKYMGYK